MFRGGFIYIYISIQNTSKFFLIWKIWKNVIQNHQLVNIVVDGLKYIYKTELHDLSNYVQMDEKTTGNAKNKQTNKQKPTRVKQSLCEFKFHMSAFLV